MLPIPKELIQEKSDLLPNKDPYLRHDDSPDMKIPIVLILDDKVHDW